MSVHRLGFWSVLSLVIGSQIGSAVFMLPASLSSFGLFSIGGWIASSIGAISLAIVFASLCAHFPKTGGPHVYIEQLFGKDVAFFAGWTYWVVSWVSTTAVVVAAIGYLSPFIGNEDPLFYLGLEIILLLSISALNLLGVDAAGKAETIFTLLKFLPLIIVPCFAIWHFDIKNFELGAKIASQTPSTNIAQAAMLTLWGFVGLESATTPAGSVENPSKTIPRALVIGTLLVAALYILNSVAIMGLVPGSKLAESTAPYVLAAQYLSNENWHLYISAAASIVCIGTLNAWILTSGQISLGLAQDKMMPKIFARKNKNSAPYFGILVCCLGIIPLLFLTTNKNIVSQVTAVIDFSVTSFLFIYLLCSIVYVVVAWREKISTLRLLNGVFAAIFCIWVIAETPLTTILISSLFTFSGIPLYLFWYKNFSNK